MTNKLGIRSYDFVEFYVGSAKMSAYWHVKALGFKVMAYKGPETGNKGFCSYYLNKNKIKIVITSSLKPEEYDMNDFIVRHGDGVKRWAMQVDCVETAFKQAVHNKAIPISVPQRLKDELGFYDEASIKLYDDLELVLVNSDHYKGVFKPHYKEYSCWSSEKSEDSQLTHIDHIVGNVRENEMDYWSEYLNQCLDFETFIYFGPGDISTRYSALLSKVVHAKDDVIKNPINEPYKGERVSQIEEFIQEFHGSGVQHIALHTDNIIKTIEFLRKNGVEFIKVPEKYYKKLEAKNQILKNNQKIMEDISALKSNEILCDLEGEGYLLQTFTKPMGDRPTFFYEIIQRCKGAKGFGQGNFKALFESIEHDQAERGALVIKDNRLSLE